MNTEEEGGRGGGMRACRRVQVCHSNVYCYDLKRKIRTLPFAFTFMLSDLYVHDANPRTSQASLNTFWYKNWGGGGGQHLSNGILMSYRISNELHLGSHQHFNSSQRVVHGNLHIVKKMNNATSKFLFIYSSNYSTAYSFVR